jgi:uncharacterized membrane protein YdjX (TVP38/TMEM64 family)
MTVDNGADLHENRSSLRSRLFIVAVAAVALAAAIHFLPIRVWLTSFQQYVLSAGAIGYVIYALVYALCCVFLVPGSILTLGAGAIFGVARGAVVVVAGATLGAIASFFLARTILRSKVRSLTAKNPRFDALDRAIAREGGKIVFLIRLSPIFPFTYMNYAFGLTGVTAAAYSLATFLGIIPGTVAFVYLGYAAAGAATGGNSTLRTILQIIGAIATLVVTIFVARLARNAIRRAGV